MRGGNRSALLMEFESEYALRRGSISSTIWTNCSWRQAKIWNEASAHKMHPPFVRRLSVSFVRDYNGATSFFSACILIVEIISLNTTNESVSFGIAGLIDSDS